MSGGTARSHSRLRASGSADLLAARGRGTSDAEAARTLRRLDRAVPHLDVSIPSLIAAHLRQHPEMTDDDVVRRIRGLDDPAVVAKVRGELAAGREPSVEGREHEVAVQTQQSAQQPPLRKGERRTLSDEMIAAAMPTYEVTGPDGPVTRCATYEEARMLRARVGGTLSAVTNHTA